MEMSFGPLLLTFSNDPTYRVGSADNLRHYDHVYQLSKEKYVPNTKLGIDCRAEQGIRHSCLFLAAAGATGIHEHSAVVSRGKCFFAVGDMLCALSLPELQLVWATKVDSATCFGVHYSPKNDFLISHGEMEIARVDFEGRILWTAGGRDIFTGSFRLDDKYVHVADFNDLLYRIDIETGKQDSNF